MKFTQNHLFEKTTDKKEVETIVNKTFKFTNRQDLVRLKLLLFLTNYKTLGELIADMLYFQSANKSSKSQIIEFSHFLERRVNKRLIAPDFFLVRLFVKSASYYCQPVLTKLIELSFKIVESTENEDLLYEQMLSFKIAMREKVQNGLRLSSNERLLYKRAINHLEAIVHERNLYHEFNNPLGKHFQFNFLLKKVDLEILAMLLYDAGKINDPQSFMELFAIEKTQPYRSSRIIWNGSTGELGYLFRILIIAEVISSDEFSGLNGKIARVFLNSRGKEYDSKEIGSVLSRSQAKCASLWSKKEVEIYPQFIKIQQIVKRVSNKWNKDKVLISN